MTVKDNIEAVRGDPAGLERLYQSAETDGHEAAFRTGIVSCLAAHPGDVLLEAWAYRLGLPVVPVVASVVVPAAEAGSTDRHWWVVIGASVVLGILSAVLAGGEPPVPVPDAAEGNVWFWVGWGPLLALGVLGYLAWAERTAAARKRYALAAVAVVGVALYAGLTLGARTDNAAVLGALHLPFVSWAIVGVALCIGYPDPARQAYAFLVKSVETVLTGGIFFGAGVIFVGLTASIFAVMEIEIPEGDLVVLVAWALGALPLLALGSVYDAAASPIAQDWHAGLTRTLRILARLLLPLALGVLLIYVLWFIPVHFRKPFEEREILFVYNLTILAIMALLVIVVSGPVDDQSVTQQSLFRYAVLVLGGLTLILNVYALAAVLSRTLDAGLTPNRFTVIGWNVTTLVILGALGTRLWRARRMPWMPVFRASMGLLVTIAAAWALSLLLVLPLF